MNKSMLSVLVVLSLASCSVGTVDLGDDTGSAGETGDGDGTGRVDAGLPASCEDSPALELGRCLQAGTQLACTGQSDEELEFVALSDGAEMSLVLGPQGSQMFFFLARGSGFDPGDPEQVGSTDNPLIEMWLHDVESDEEIARYRGYVPFVEDGSDTSLVTAGGVFAVTEHGPAALAGHEVDVEAVLRDRAGAVRCGQVRIMVAG